jgi:hypothetical protein
MFSKSRELQARVPSAPFFDLGESLPGEQGDRAGSWQFHLRYESREAARVARVLLSDWLIVKILAEFYGGVSVLQPLVYFSKAKTDHLDLSKELKLRYPPAGSSVVSDRPRGIPPDSPRPRLTPGLGPGVHRGLRQPRLQGCSTNPLSTAPAPAPRRSPSLPFQLDHASYYVLRQTLRNDARWLPDITSSII